MVDRKLSKFNMQKKQKKNRKKTKAKAKGKQKTVETIDIVPAKQEPRCEKVVERIVI